MKVKYMKIQFYAALIATAMMVLPGAASAQKLEYIQAPQCGDWIYGTERTRECVSAEGERTIEEIPFMETRKTGKALYYACTPWRLHILKKPDGLWYDWRQCLKSRFGPTINVYRVNAKQ